MSKITFPNSPKVYIQNNRSNVYPSGNLWSTMGMDFQSNLGVARVAPRMQINSQVSDLANLGVPVAFKYFDGAFRTVAGARVFTGGATPNVAFTQDAVAGTPTDCSSDSADMGILEGKLFVTTQTKLVVNGSVGGYTTWADADTGLTSGIPHIIRYFPLFNRLYYTNGTTIRSIDTSGVVASSGDYFLSLPFGNLITSMEVTDDSIWIGTQSKDVPGMNGNVYQWDGISAQATDVFPVDAVGVAAIAVNDKSGIPTIMDTNGILSEFNGQGFSEIGRLPYAGSLPFNTALTSNKYIHWNGLIYTKNNTFLALINNLNQDNTSTINENLPSGIWEWSKETNFVSKYLFTYNPISSPSVIRDWGQNRISRAGALINADVPSTAASRNGTLLAGAAIYTTASATTNAIFSDDSNNTIQKRGYMVSDWWESVKIADKWERFWMSYRKFLGLQDDIIIKYRITEEAPVEAAITWINSNSFTVLNSAVVATDYWTGGTGTTGNEVEITRGDGGGACAHITNAVLAGGTWTVTLDEAINNSGGSLTATARFQKWIKLSPTESLQPPANWAQLAIDTDSTPRIQIKMCFTFTGNDEFYRSVIISNEDIQIK